MNGRMWHFELSQMKIFSNWWKETSSVSRILHFMQTLWWFDDPSVFFFCLHNVNSVVNNLMQLILDIDPCLFFLLTAHTRTLSSESSTLRPVTDTSPSVRWEFSTLVVIFHMSAWRITAAISAMNLNFIDYISSCTLVLWGKLVCFIVTSHFYIAVSVCRYLGKAIKKCRI